MAAEDEKSPMFKTKKCYECYTYVALDTRICPSCGKTLGRVNKVGIAEKPTDWKSYLICLVAWIALGFFIWIGFF